VIISPLIFPHPEIREGGMLGGWGDIMGQRTRVESL
jgi:hypothetical protein